jgi:DNA phosphorothioation system restriction enzyme
MSSVERKGLEDLGLELEYRSDGSSTLHDFYIPCLEVSTTYKRAVGYFTSTALTLASRGLDRFIANNGTMELLASPVLNETDIEAIKQGYETREHYIAESISREIPDSLTDEAEAFKHGWECLAWMVANGTLDIFLAVPDNAEDGSGIYHEKVGVFTDHAGDRVAFTGSVNETAGGLFRNFESIDVFSSWIEAEQQRVEQKEANLDRLMSNRTQGLMVYEFPEACRERVLRLRPPSAPDIRYEPREGSGIVQDRGRRAVLRPYQQEALRSWFENNGVGTLKMATGSGKTIVALETALTLCEKTTVGTVIIICPYKHLVDQWAEQCARYGLRPILAYESRARWLEVLNGAVYSALSKPEESIWLIVTNATFAGQAFQEKLEQLKEPLLLIADEAHNLGAVGLREKLPEDARFRLALSATPERWYDESGTEALLSYFGDVLQPEFSISDALEARALVPYEYHPIIVELEEPEAEEYLRISKKIAAVAAGSIDEADQRVQHLLIQRARLVASAGNKLLELRRLLSSMAEVDHLLVYCGDGSSEDDQGAAMRQVERICQILGNELGIRTATFTAETKRDERQRLIGRLDDGSLQALVAIRCLDEGVDIPSVETGIILASSTNPRQFIQRRGRLLRPSPGKTRAKIYDMIVTPPTDAEGYESERSLVRRELQRFRQFAELAINSGTASLEVLDLQKRFGLLDT